MLMALIMRDVLSHHISETFLLTHHNASSQNKASDEKYAEAIKNLAEATLEDFDVDPKYLLSKNRKKNIIVSTTSILESPVISPFFLLLLIRILLL